jgi:hypothetical protein
MGPNACWLVYFIDWRLAAIQWQDGAVMKSPEPRRRYARIMHAQIVLMLTAVFAWPPSRVNAAPVALTASDVALALYASDGSSSHELKSDTLAGFFGAHRCLCPDTLSPTLQLTSSGQTNMGTSTVSVNFLLGANCQSTPADCVSVGQATFTASQSALSPTFSSNLVYQAAAGSSGYNCASLTAGSTTLWAVITQDGVALSFSAPTVNLPVITTTVAAPKAITALAADTGILVTWTPPADTSLVAGYQVLCLPGPAVPATAGYETCGLSTSVDGGIVLTPADITQVCSVEVSASTTQARLSGLVNGTSYTVAVIAIDPSGGVSALSPTAVATPQPTTGFYEKYKQAGGAATGCAVSPLPQHGRAGLLWIAIAVALVIGRERRGQRDRRNHRAKATGRLLSAILLLAFSTSARAQIRPERSSDDWAMNPGSREGIDMPPDWGLEIGISLYRPDVDSEFGGAAHPYADTFGSSRHLMSELEIDRYLGHRFGSWGVGVRVGYQKLTGAAVLSDGTRSGDETGLRLVPISVSALYKADGLPGLRSVPLVPYAKAGLDGVVWTESTTGGKANHNGFTVGWHAAAGLALGLNSLGLGANRPGAIAGPGSLFFEWDYAAINGLGLGKELRVGDSTWFAGLMFDL